MFERILTTDGPQSDRRSEARGSVSWRGKVVDAQGHASPIKFADVSASGCSIHSESRFAINQVLTLHVEVPRLPDMDVREMRVWRGIVQRQTLKGDLWAIGLRFDAPSPGDTELRAAWVRRVAVSLTLSTSRA
jgi:PilZ domain